MNCRQKKQVAVRVLLQCRDLSKTKMLARMGSYSAVKVARYSPCEPLYNSTASKNVLFSSEEWIYRSSATVYTVSLQTSMITLSAGSKRVCSAAYIKFSVYAALSDEQPAKRDFGIIEMVDGLKLLIAQNVNVACVF